jgi:hypothetical protein
MCSDVNPTTNENDPLYRHGVGTSVAVTDVNGDTYYVNCEAQVVVGEYIGAQMAGFDAAAELGLIDHLQDGDRNVAYTPRTVVVGGAQPYNIVLQSGNLPQGLSIDTYTDPLSGLVAFGVLFGTPIESGDFQFTVEATDSDGAVVSQAYTLHIAGDVVSQYELMVQKSGAGAGSVSGNGIDCGVTCTVLLDADTAVSLTATAAPGSVFTGWSGDCSGTSTCDLTMLADHVVTATFAVSGIDLRVTAVSAPPALASPGTAFDVTDTTVNTGALLAGISVTRFHFSTDKQKSSDDVRLKGSRALPGLDSGVDSTGQTTLTIPASLSPGTYWQLACADDARSVSESNEDNNCLVSDTAVEVRRPDLVETSVSDPPAALAPGNKFAVTDTVQNASTVSTIMSATRYYFTIDAVKDPGDVMLTGTRSVSGLAAAATSTGSRMVTVPSTTPLGTYRLVACADDKEKLAESNEGNNCVASAGAVLIAWPDLTVTELGGVPATIGLGRKMTLTDAVVNQGQGPAGTSTVRYYASPDITPDAGDVLLVGARAVLALGPGATSIGGRSVTVPLTTAAGTYYILACADDTNKVLEVDDGNNCKASTTTVVVMP